MAGVAGRLVAVVVVEDVHMGHSPRRLLAGELGATVEETRLLGGRPLAAQAALLPWLACR